MSNLSNLQQRIITAVIGASIMLFALWYNSISYALLWGAILVLSHIEFHQLMRKASIGSRLAPVLLVSMFFYTMFLVAWLNMASWLWLLLVPVMVLLIFLSELFRQESKPFEFNAYTVLNFIYLSLPITSLHLISHFDRVYHLEVIFGLLLLLWGNDTGGYFAGRFLGKHKLYERISPKKTWEGSIGGLLLSLAAAYGVSLFADDIALKHWLILSVLVVVFGSLGDLVESQLKRSIEIKDSGSMIPGHGGFLDRFDGLFFCAPPCAAYIQLVIQNNGF